MQAVATAAIVRSRRPIVAAAAPIEDGRRIEAAGVEEIVWI